MIQGAHSGPAVWFKPTSVGTCGGITISTVYVECSGTSLFETTANGLQHTTFDRLTVNLGTGMNAFKLNNGYGVKVIGFKSVNSSVVIYDITDTVAQLSAFGMGPTEIAAQIVDGGGNYITWVEAGTNGGALHVATATPIVPVAGEWSPGLAAGQGPIHFNPMTSTERDAMSSPKEGWVIANSTTHKLQYYTGSAWVDLF
jgi:hypothetical protein